MPKDVEMTGIIGLGYVGLPLLLDFCEAGKKVIGFDIDINKVNILNKGQSYISYISDKRVSNLLNTGLFKPTNDFSLLSKVDNIIITVPTPLNQHREPDLQYVEETAKIIANKMRKGQLIILESTTYPGTSRNVILPILEKTGFKVGDGFYLAYSPERVDPNNKNYRAIDIPKVVGGITSKCLDKAMDLYGTIFSQLVPVSNTEVAEASKLLENIFRSVNIALVNELKMLFDRMGIDTWEVIDASSTKPFGFMPFYPGPGLGGHCLPIDPFYLTWKAREYDFVTRFIELSGEINTSMPYYVVNKIIEALNERNKSLNNSRLLILGVAYKKDVDDIRESPAIKIIKLLQEKGANVCYFDPYITEIKDLRGHPDVVMESQLLNAELLEEQDGIIIITDHSCIDFKWVLKHGRLVIDTRNVLKGILSNKIVRA